MKAFKLIFLVSAITCNVIFSAETSKPSQARFVISAWITNYFNGVEQPPELSTKLTVSLEAAVKFEKFGFTPMPGLPMQGSGDYFAPPHTFDYKLTIEGGTEKEQSKLQALLEAEVSKKT